MCNYTFHDQSDDFELGPIVTWVDGGRFVVSFNYILLLFLENQDQNQMVECLQGSSSSSFLRVTKLLHTVLPATSSSQSRIATP